MKIWIIGKIEARARSRNLNYINIPSSSYFKILDRLDRAETKILELYDKSPSVSIADISASIEDCNSQGSHKLLIAVDIYTVCLDIAFFRYLKHGLFLKINGGSIAPSALLSHMNLLSRKPSDFQHYAGLIEKYDRLYYDKAQHNTKSNIRLAESLIPVYKDYPTITKYLKGLASLTPNH